MRTLAAASIALASLVTVLPAAAGSPALLEALDQRVRSGLQTTSEAYEQARLQAEGSSEAPEPPTPAAVIRRGSRASGAVALTFDDGYNSDACARIARTLRKHDAVGTFFINGMHLKRDPDKWQRILRGMSVGNHTRSHRYLPRERRAVVRRQIRDNEAIHERVLGRPMLKVLRPPYGAYGGRVRRIATELGYEYLALWTVDTKDWQKGTSTRQIVRRATRASPGSIILMHCGPNATARAMPAIVRHYKARGIELAGIEDVVLDAKPAHQGAKPKGYGKP